MEIYKDTNTAASKEFEKLLNNQISKTKNLIEGKIIEGVVTKISEKYVFLFIEGLKSEPLVDINEIKTLGLENKLKIGEKIQVLLERIEDKNGEVIVSASKAQKIKGWDILVKALENNEPIMGKITSKCKGGVIVEHMETGSLMFCPGSQISDIPIKDISHLMNEPQKFALIKMDKVRGNACVSRRQIISSGKKEDKLGMRASETAELIFDQCILPDENRLGELGEGFIHSMKILDGGRISIAALSLGIARGAYEAALKYSKERVQFGKPISSFQGISFKLAEMATQIEAAELLTHNASQLINQGKKMTKESAICKLFASEACVSIANEAVQIFGGYGYSKEFPVEKFYRDSKLCTIGEGTSEIQKVVIAKQILK